MNTFLKAPKHVRLGAVLIVLLAPVAVYQATAPIRAERALQHASLQELQTKALANPNDLQAQLYLARKAALEGQYPMAMAAYQKVAGGDSASESVWIEWANTAAASGNIPLAISLLKAFEQNHPASALSHIALGEISLQGNSPDQALQEAENAAKIDPSLPDALILKGQALEAAGEHDQAKHAIAQAEGIAPNNWQVYQAKGDIDFDQKNYTKAIANFRKAVDLQPDSGLPYERLGNALLKTDPDQEQMAEALQSLETAASRAGVLSREDRFQTYAGLGRIAEEQRRWGDAVGWFQKAIATRPDHMSVYYELAVVYREEGDMADYEKETQVHETLYNRTLEGIRLNDHLRAAPNDTQARLQLARLYASYRDDQDAEEQYEFLLHLTPGDQVANRELAALEKKDAAPATSVTAP